MFDPLVFLVYGYNSYIGSTNLKVKQNYFTSSVSAKSHCCSWWGISAAEAFLSIQKPVDRARYSQVLIDKLQACKSVVIMLRPCCRSVQKQIKLRMSIHGYINGYMHPAARGPGREFCLNVHCRTLLWLSA